MKIINRILLVLACIIALLLIAAFFMKKEFVVEREIGINKPRTDIFDYIKFLKNQNTYSVWATKDPAMKKDFRGTDGTVGFVSAWDSDYKDVGKGEQEITKITEGERIDFELRFMEPYETTNTAYMTTESLNDSVTTVKWGFIGKIPYPMNLTLFFMNMDEMLGGDLENGLVNLKRVMEAK